MSKRCAVGISNLALLTLLGLNPYDVKIVQAQVDSTSYSDDIYLVFEGDGIEGGEEWEEGKDIPYGIVETKTVISKVKIL